MKSRKKSNKNYRKGYKIERKIVLSLREDGFMSERSAGSHGLWDVVGVRGDKILLIQAKSIKFGNSYCENESVKEFRKSKVPPCVEKYLYVWEDRKGWKEKKKL